MLDFDVPYFSAPVHGTSLNSPEMQLDAFFEASAFEQSVDRIEHMGHPDWIDRQLAFAATTLGISACSCRQHMAINEVVDRLDRQAFRGDDGTVTWTYSPPSDMPGAEFAIAAMGPDLYTGMAGVLATLSLVPEAPRDLLDSALETALRMCRERSAELPSGAYTGFEGMLLAIAEAGDTLQRPDLLQEAVERFIACEARWEQNRYDVLDGAAGMALIALALHRRSEDPRLIELAVGLGDRLLDSAQQTAHGLQWPLHTIQKAVTGFAHGASGIGYALAEIGHASGEERFVEAARRAISQDDSEFNATHSLWRDTRTDGENYALGWCNGSAGFLLARAACWNLLDEPQRERTRAAFRRTCEWFERTQDDSLCHGTAGIALALHEVADTLGEQPTANVSLPANDQGFRSGWEQDPDNLGMMVGVLGRMPAWASGTDRLRMHPLMLLRPSQA